MGITVKQEYYTTKEQDIIRKRWKKMVEEAKQVLNRRRLKKGMDVKMAIEKPSKRG